jgi:hypothetical protein
MLSAADATELSPHSEHEAHEHGHATLNIAVEGTSLLLELKVPAADIVGFEHAPHTAAEQQQFDAALTTLHQADNIVDLEKNSGCKLQQVKVQHHLDDKASTAHGDIEASYAYSCQSPGELTSITLTLFRHFASLQDIDYQIMTQSHQGAGELSPDHPQLELQE